MNEQHEYELTTNVPEACNIYERFSFIEVRFGDEMQKEFYLASMWLAASKIVLNAYIHNVPLEKEIEDSFAYIRQRIQKVLEIGKEK